MTVNDAEYKSSVGVDQLYYAPLVSDTLAGYAAGTPKFLAPTANVSNKPKTSQDTQYADNRPFDTSATEAETDLEFEVTAVPLSVAAELLGKPFDPTTGRLIDMPSAVPPKFAVGWRSEKMNGKKRYYWYLSVQFSAPEESAKTIADKKEPQTIKLAAKAVKTVYQWTQGGVTDGVKRVMGDEDADAFNATGWFDQVQVPGVGAISALSLSSSVPANNATGVSKAAGDLVLTFNNALDANSINGVVLLDNTPAVVTTTATLDSTKKIMTVHHASALAATTAHTIVVSVRDIYNQTLNVLVKFTTGS